MPGEKKVSNFIDYKSKLIRSLAREGGTVTDLFTKSYSPGVEIKHVMNVLKLMEAEGEIRLDGVKIIPLAYPNGS